MTPTASQIAVQALGLKPVGRRWDGPDDVLTCALESRPIKHGDLVMPWVPGSSFMGEHETTRSPVVGGYPAALLPKTVMLKSQRTLFTREGAYSLATDAARSWFFLTPPEPPFVAVISDSMLQHLIWRTPVNWSSERFVFRQGDALLTIRHQRLLEAVDVLMNYGVEAIPGSTEVTPRKPVFVALDRERKNPVHGILRHDVPAFVRAQLADLTPGEVMALATLCKRTPATPEKPPAYRLDNQSPTKEKQIVDAY